MDALLALNQRSFAFARHPAKAGIQCDL